MLETRGIILFAIFFGFPFLDHLSPSLFYFLCVCVCMHKHFLSLSLLVLSPTQPFNNVATSNSSTHPLPPVLCTQYPVPRTPF